MIAAYLGMSIVAALAVVAAEVFWFRTGIFTTWSYWIAMTIVFAFQVPIDGWMTKLSAPIVIYNRKAISGLRFPLDIPTEEFIYAFALITLAIVLWERAGSKKAREGDRIES